MHPFFLGGIIDAGRHNGAGVLGAGVLEAGVVDAGAVGAGVMGTGAAGAGVVGAGAVGTRAVGVGGSQGGNVLSWKCQNAKCVLMVTEPRGTFGNGASLFCVFSGRGSFQQRIAPLHHLSR
jgi:hypothetical protein